MALSVWSPLLNEIPPMSVVQAFVVHSGQGDLIRLNSAIDVTFSLNCRAFRHWAWVVGEREEKPGGAKTRGVACVQDSASASASLGFRHRLQGLGDVACVRDSASASATGEGKESVFVKRRSGSRPPPIQVARLKGEVGDDLQGKEVCGHVVSPRIALLASPRERRRATINAMHTRKGAGGKGVWKF